MNGGSGFNDDGDLRDPALHHALDHAPDRDALPDARTRAAILKTAHNLASAPANASTATGIASDVPWWRSLFGAGESRTRMPWNAAFATLLVAAFVTVLWYGEPVPDARPDGEAHVGEARVDDASTSAMAAAPEKAASAKALTPAESSAKTRPPAAAPAIAAVPPSADAGQVLEAEKHGTVVGDAASAASSAKEAGNAASADAIRHTAPPHPLQKAAPAPAALERWTSLRFMRAGVSVRLERGDVEGLSALVSAVARSATTPGEPLAAPVESRLVLYQGDTRVAVLEIAGGQVRWMAPPGGAASVGTPPAQALDALRALLAR